MYKVLDLETENHKSRKRLGSPWDERNYIVARGWKNQGDARCSWTYYPEPNKSTCDIEDGVTMLIGFNLKYDLLWEMVNGNESLKAFYKRGGVIWDCQYAEYLLRGQTPDALYPSLDSIIESYGGRKKIDEVKKLWEAGLLTSQIHEDLLIDYLVGTEDEARNSGDIGNTELIFLGQIQKAIQKGMLRSIQFRMDGLCGTTEMEYNGLKIDLAEAGRRAVHLEEELDKTETELAGFIPELPEGLTFNWNSPIQKSSLIFGGSIKYEKKVPYKDETGEWARLKMYETWVLVGGEPVSAPQVLAEDLVPDRFLSGKRKGEIKTRKVEVEGPLKEKYHDFLFDLPGYTPPNSDWAGKLTDGRGGPVYSVGEDTLKELGRRDIPFTKALTSQAALSKELGTYYIRFDGKDYTGMLTCVDPQTHFIHHKLNHVNTVTTRLSSSDPNLQNLARKDKSEVKRMFISRFLEDGMMLELDYSQLEVVIQGMLSQDAALMRDLIDKIDFHCKRVAAKHGISYEEALARCKDEGHPEYAKWKAERTKCKIFSFQRAYGAGAATISVETGIDVEEVKLMIEAEERMYPGIVAYNSRVETTVAKNAVSFRDPERGWRPFRRGFYQAPTGCLYSFRSWDAPKFMKDKGIVDTFSPPELKNYPVQGTGGEVVQIIMGLIWRQYVATDNYGGLAYLCNTVHDCFWADTHKSVSAVVARDMHQIMESLPGVLEDAFGMPVGVPFPADVEWGPNMYDLKHFHYQEHLN